MYVVAVMIVSDQLYVYRREMRVTHRMAVTLMIVYIHVAPYLGIIFLCVCVCVCVCREDREDREEKGWYSH